MSRKQYHNPIIFLLVFILIGSILNAAAGNPRIGGTSKIQLAGVGEYFITLKTQGHGSILNSYGKEIIPENEEISLTAIPAPGWIFSNWEGDVDSPHSPETTVTITQNALITAIFTRILDNSSSVIAGAEYSLALDHDKTVWAWGSNVMGQLGDGTVNIKHSPINVPSLNNIEALAAGSEHTIALKADGTVWAWGSNVYGQLGNGTTDVSYIPVQVHNLNNIIAIAAGSEHAVALKADGTVWTWGYNSYGQLGDGTILHKYIPVQVSLDNVVAIAAGGYHTIALKNDGTVWAWGNNEHGQLGDGTKLNKFTPVQVHNLNNIVAIAAGGEHTVAVKGDGTVWAWGRNYYGQLGDGTGGKWGAYRSTPVQVQGLNNITTIACGYRHTIALDKNGNGWVWGWNVYGQLGDGTTTTRYTPVPLQYLDNIVDITAGTYHTIALKADGSVWTWGYNSYGQLGDGTTENKLLPVQTQLIEQIESGLYPNPTRLQNFRVLEEAEFDWTHPRSVDAEGNWWGVRGASIRISQDGGLTWKNFYTFPSGYRPLHVFPLANGALVVCMSKAGIYATAGCSEVWVSDANKDFTAEGYGYKFTLTVNAEVLPWWGWDTYENVVLLSEYGTYDPVNTPRKIYLSQDYGATWKTIWERAKGDKRHQHDVRFDPWANRIWATYGDVTGDPPFIEGTGGSNLIYSDDFGETWTLVHAVEGIQQSTAIEPREDCVLFGSDEQPDGVYKWERDIANPQKPVIPADIKRVFAFDKYKNPLLLGHVAYRGKEINGVLYMPFENYSDGYGRLIVTPDNKHFFEVWRNPNRTNKQGIRSVIGIDGNGKLRGVWYTGSAPRVWVADPICWEEQ